MRALLHLTAFMSLIWAAAIMAARPIGQPHAAPITALFTNADGSSCPMPCLFGILPGETRSTEARTLLRSHPLTTNFKYVEESSTRNGGGYTFVSQNSVITYHLDFQRRIRDVWLEYRQGYKPYLYNAARLGPLLKAGELDGILKSIRLGDMLLLGEPLSAWVHECPYQERRLSYTYPNGVLVVVGIKQPIINPAIQVQWLGFFAYPLAPDKWKALRLPDRCVN